MPAFNVSKANKCDKDKKNIKPAVSNRYETCCLKSR